VSVGGGSISKKVLRARSARIAKSVQGGVGVCKGKGCSQRGRAVAILDFYVCQNSYSDLCIILIVSCVYV